MRCFGWRLAGIAVAVTLASPAYGTFPVALGRRLFTLSGPGREPPTRPDISYDVGAKVLSDAMGTIYVVGDTASPDFPTTAGAFQRSLRGGGGFYGTDAFAMKIDPSGALVYSTFLGGCDTEFVSGAAVDRDGNLIVVGYTESRDFPTVNALQPVAKSSTGAFVTKLDPAGSVVFSTHLGGKYNTGITAVTTDEGDAIYVTGNSNSPDFPVTASPCTRDGDALIAKLEPGGDLVFATCFGGTFDDSGWALAVDRTGNVHVAGGTRSGDFPTSPGALQRDLRRTDGFSTNGFVAVFDPVGSQIVQATLLPMDDVRALAVDDGGAAYVASRVTAGTQSAFAPTPGAFQVTGGGFEDAVVAKLDPRGERFVYATYLGGSALDGADAIAVDEDGAAYVAGETQSDDFPVTGSAVRRDNVLFDTFATKLDPGGTAVVYSTYLGADSVRGIDLAPGRSLAITGTTFLDDLATTANAVESTREGIDGFLVVLASDGSRFDYATFLGAGRRTPAVVPPLSAPDCQLALAGRLRTLARSIMRCDATLASARFGRMRYDTEACVRRARRVFDAAAARLAGCPPCVDHRRAADVLESELRLHNAEFYRSGTKPLDRNRTGFVPRTARTLRCENELARRADRRLAGGLACEAAGAPVGPTCPPAHSQVLRHCPRCLEVAVGAVEYRADTIVDELTGPIFCATVPLDERAH